MEREFSQLTFERDDDSEAYTLYGLPAGADFTDPDSYVEVTAAWLKVNGVAFSAPAGEFGEHDHTITVEQETEGGGANIAL